MVGFDFLLYMSKARRLSIMLNKISPLLRKISELSCQNSKSLHLTVRASARSRFRKPTSSYGATGDTPGPESETSVNKSNEVKSTLDRTIPRRIARRLENIHQKQLKLEASRKRRTELVNELNNTRSKDGLIDKDTDEIFVSDFDNNEMLLQRPEKEAKKTTSQFGVNPEHTSVILFPGQGSQFVGMGKQIQDYPRIEEMFYQASRILGYDLLHVCLNGPKEKLRQTIYSQAAVVVTSLAALEILREEQPEVISHCVGTAGFSVGEISAMIFSGLLSFKDGIQLVKVRAEAMHEATQEAQSGMVTVHLFHDCKLGFAMNAAREYCKKRCGIEHPQCAIANYLGPNIRVVAGHQEALDFLMINQKEFAFKKIQKLPVSGAFHTRLMQSAVESVKKELENIRFGKMEVPLYSSVTGKFVHRGTKGNIIKKMICDQIVQPVLWEQINMKIYRRAKDVSHPKTFEVGPGKQLGTLLRICNNAAYQNYYSIDV